MLKRNNKSRGFTLIAALLILVLLSGVAAGLLYMVNNEARMSSNDQESNLAFYGAESGMEKLASDMAALYQQYMVPTTSQIQALKNSPPPSSLVPGMSYNISICFPTSTGCLATNDATTPPTTWNTVSAGGNQGLYAEIVPVSLQVIATRPAGASVNITRKVEVALIPVFQFGVFCGYDCSYFPGPNFSFGGRVHTNDRDVGGHIVTVRIGEYLAGCFGSQHDRAPAEIAQVFDGFDEARGAGPRLRSKAACDNEHAARRRV